ncbi:MAG: hypothetical protein HOV80_33940 [Polyangiaceae bacterium]|nr:hypothetical protein [Polyangiaceae bacterium]
MTALSSACGDDGSEGIRCYDSEECPVVECGNGVTIEICTDNLCVTDPEIACEQATTSSASGQGGS